jgi:hypothetical protein
MSLLDGLRKGFGYVLLAMGVSRPQTKPLRSPAQPSPAPPSEPQPPVEKPSAPPDPHP